MDGGLLSSSGSGGDFSLWGLFYFDPLSVLAIVSVLWLIGGPLLSALLSLDALNFASWAARRRKAGQLAEEGEPVTAPFLRFSRGVFGVYAMAGMIIVPTFVYVLLPAIQEALTEGPRQCGDPFPAVLIINVANLFGVLGYGLLCHLFAARLRARLNNR